MPLPRAVARFNRVFTNRLFGPLAGRVPPWVLVEHRGRRSGKLYRTVVWAFFRRGELVFALTYGPGADWVQNVLAAEWCRVKWLGTWRTCTRAELLHGQPGRRLLPPPLRLPLRLAGVNSVLRVRTE